MLHFYLKEQRKVKVFPVPITVPRSLVTLPHTQVTMTSEALLLTQVEGALSVPQTSKSDLDLLYNRAMWVIHGLRAKCRAFSLLD